MIYDLAQLSDEQLATLKSFEEQTGRTVLALRFLRTRPAQLEDEEVSRLQTLEQELGLTLVAVEN